MIVKTPRGNGYWNTTLTAKQAVAHKLKNVDGLSTRIIAIKMGIGYNSARQHLICADRKILNWPEYNKAFVEGNYIKGLEIKDLLGV